MSWTRPAYEAVARLVSGRTGLNLSLRTEGAESGIRHAMARAGLSDLDRYLERIAEDESALDDLINELTIGETYFFREPDHFRFLKTIILPEILERLGREHLLRIWSAACASGEEPYSVAMLIDQMGLTRQTTVMATDISRAALAQARRAIYEAWSLRSDHGR